MAAPGRDPPADARRASVGVALGLAAYACWGLLSPVGKHLLDAGAYRPLGLNAVRFTVAAIVALLYLGPSGIRATLVVLRRRDVWWFNLLANASLALFLFSLVDLPPAYATLGFYTAPLWTAAWARFRLGEHVGVAFVPASIGLLVGGYLALFGRAAPSGVNPWGLALAVASGLVWAFYTVSLRRGAPDLELKPLMGASFVIGAFFFLVPALVVEGVPDLVHQTMPDVGWMVVYVAGPTLASFVLFTAATQRAPASLVNILVGAELAFTILFSWLLFGRTYQPIQLVGLGVALLSVTLYLVWQARRQTTTTVGGSL